MLTFLAIVHVLIAIVLVIFVLLQDSKGGAMGVFGGGSSNTFFGSTGATNFLVTATRWLALAFAISCLTLTYLSTRRNTSVLDNAVIPATAPTAPNPAATPVAPTAPAEETKQDTKAADPAQK